MTLFTNYIDLNNIDFAFTCFIIDKWKGFFKICLILLNDLQPYLMNSDIEQVSILMKDDNTYNKYHSNRNKNFYLYTKFKVTEKELQNLRDEYYMQLAEEKVKNNEKWEKDQKQPLLYYIKEKEKINKESKKQIILYKKMIEAIDKKLLIALSAYNKYMKLSNQRKKKLDKIAEEKLYYENLYKIFNSGIRNLEVTENMDKLKTDIIVSNIRKVNKENEKKKELISQELSKVYEKYNPIKSDYFKETMELYQDFNKIDEKIIQIEKIEKEKIKRKQQLEDFLFQLDYKNKQLINTLCQELKLSENYKKYKKF